MLHPESAFVTTVKNRPRRRALGPRIVGAVVLWAALVGTQEASADRIERGVVLSIEAGEAYFDVARTSGLETKRPIRIKRPVSLPHPITGEVVRDELLIGGGEVAMVGERLSMIRLRDSLVGKVRVGDVVEALIESDEPIAIPVAPTPAKAITLPPVPHLPKAAEAAVLTWHANAGATPSVKHAAWIRYLELHPKSAHRESIEIYLAALDEATKRLPTRVAENQPRVRGFKHNQRTTVNQGESVALAISARDADAVIGSWLHYRTIGEDSYSRARLARDGDSYFRGTLEGPQVRAPGLEYFVEVANKQGRAGLAIGTPSKPIVVEVIDGQQDARAFTETRNRSRVSVSTDYLDFSTFDRRRIGDDYRDAFFQFQADFLFRLRAKTIPLQGIRVGMGAINGTGGFADEMVGEDAGFNYGYTDFEFRILQESAVSVRAVAGIGKAGLGFGAEGRVRLGAEDQSNLTFGVSSLSEIGFLSEVRMQWAAIPRMPLGFSVGVSDRPNQGDLGVRLGADIGYRVRPWFQPALRVSYQGRSLAHSGIGIGTAMVFDW